MVRMIKTAELSIKSSELFLINVNIRATKCSNRGINVYSALQSVKTAEFMFIPGYKVLKSRN